MNFSKLKTILFDLDGTLLDTAPDIALALNKLLEQEGYSPVSVESIRTVISEGSKSILSLGFNINDTHPNFLSFKDDFTRYYHQHISRETALFPGMESVLDSLEEQGITWGVVTNKQTYLAKQLLDDLNLATRAVCIIGSDCVTHIKPHPEPLLLACERIQSTPAECVYIGDAKSDIEAARKANMRSIAALYGYLPEDASPEGWGANFYIDRPADILEWVKRQ